MLLLTSLSYSQQLPVYSQYFMNRFLINPARAGAYGYTTIDLTAREQWIGFKGAPKTHVIAYETRILKKSFMSSFRSPRSRYGGAKRGGKVGFGAMLFNDQTGIIDYSGAQGTYAYHIKMRESQLSLGVSLSMFQFKLDKDNIITYDNNDKLLDNSNLTLYIPDAVIGAYYLFPNFYAGISATQLFQSSLKFGSIDSKYTKIVRYYYTMAGYKLKFDRYWQSEVSFLYKTNELLHSQLDLNFRTVFMENYWAGLAYRTGGKKIEESRNGGAVIFMFGVSIDRFHFGYALDYTLNNIQSYSYGSHEINVAIQFGDTAPRYRWLDRF